jgi:hypothetical protein
LRESMLRTGRVPQTDRERSQSTFHNPFCTRRACACTAIPYDSATPSAWV